MLDAHEEIDRLRLAAAAAGAGIWDFNIDAGTLYCDERWHRILGLDFAHPVRTMDEFRPYIHPEDVEHATQVHPTFDQLVSNGDDYRISFRIIRPDGEVRWVKSAACLIAGGDGSPNRAVGAIVDVTGEFNAKAALADSEQLLKTLANTVPQIIFAAQPDGSIDYLNRRWNEFTGAERPIDDEPWFAYLHPEDRAGALEAWAQAVESGEKLRCEFRYRHVSGEYRWLLVEAEPLRGEDGRVVRWVGSNTDVHADKQLQAERELVARELDHRLKNIFMIVESLVALSVRDDPVMKPYAERLRQRLRALAVAHNLIWQAEAKGHRLHRLLQTLLAPYQNDSQGHCGARFTIRGADPEIRDLAVTPLALLFHELATNAAKYGALQSASGKVRVDIEHGVEEIRIAWLEEVVTSLPFSRGSAEPSGFGSKLFALVVERQLGGRYTHELAPTGARVRMAFPVPSLVEVAEA